VNLVWRPRRRSSQKMPLQKDSHHLQCQPIPRPRRCNSEQVIETFEFNSIANFCSVDIRQQQKCGITLFGGFFWCNSRKTSWRSRIKSTRKLSFYPALPKDMKDQPTAEQFLHLISQLTKSHEYLAALNAMSKLPDWNLAKNLFLELAPLGSRNNTIAPALQSLNRTVLLTRL